MTRITSIETFKQITEEGMLSPMREKVYTFIHKHQPVTLLQMVQLGDSKVSTMARSFAPRTTELLKMGLIYEHHTGPCPVSGRNVIHWSTTDNLPATYVVPPTRKEKKALTRKAINKTYKYIANKVGKDSKLIEHFKEVVRNLDSI